MTVIIELNCDGYGCYSSTFIDGIEAEDIERHGWRCDPDDSETHYCPGCWKKIQSELNQRGEPHANQY